MSDESTEHPTEVRPAPGLLEVALFPGAYTPEQREAALIEAREAVASIMDTWHTFARTFVETATPLIEQVAWACQTLSTLLEDRYRAVGQPYGSGQEAMLTFFTDMRAAEGARSHAYREMLNTWIRESAAQNILYEQAPLPVPALPPIEPYLPERLREALKMMEAGRQMRADLDTRNMRAYGGK